MSQMQINEVLAQIRSFSTTRTASAGNAPASGVSGFGDLLKQGIDAVNRSQQGAASLADSYERAVPGVELAQVMLESQKAAISFRALTEVRNRLVTVYQDIMNMAI